MPLKTIRLDRRLSWFATHWLPETIDPYDNVIPEPQQTLECDHLFSLSVALPILCF